MHQESARKKKKIEAVRRESEREFAEVCFIGYHIRN
jgi:hypothetical protein